jgi:hypothetical protein
VLSGVGYAVAVTPTGDMVQAGADRQDPLAAVVEVRDRAGAIVWSDQERGAANLGARALGVGVDAEGFVHVLLNETVTDVRGESSATHDARLVVLRYGPDGSHRWRWVREHPPVEPWGSYDVDGVLSVEGDVVHVVQMPLSEPMVHIRLDRFGNVIEESTLQIPPDLGYRSVASVADDRTYVAGDRDDGAGHHPVWVAALDEEGAVAWSHQFGTIDDQAVVVLGTADGGAYLVWRTRFPDRHEQSLRRYAPDGTELWTVSLPTSGAEAGVIDCEGAVLLTGGIEKPPTPDLEWDMRSDLWVGAYGDDGGELWTASVNFGPPYAYGSGSDVAVTTDGDVVVVGSHTTDGDNAPWAGRFADR